MSATSYNNSMNAFDGLIVTTLTFSNGANTSNLITDTPGDLPGVLSLAAVVSRSGPFSTTNLVTHLSNKAAAVKGFSQTLKSFSHPKP